MQPDQHETLIDRWSKTAHEALAGRTIRDAFYGEVGGGDVRLIVELDDGTAFTVESDDEGNHAGALSFFPVREGVALKTQMLPRVR